jgi:prepilin-type N-terminal cleavage/methylation domain-containing protein
MKDGASVRRRVSRRRSREAGLTLIELLISLALLTVLTAFLAGGLVMGRRGFEADRGAAIEAESDQAVAVISELIGSAIPIAIGNDHKNVAAFDGSTEAISFVGLSEGHAIPGGPTRFHLQREGSDLVVSVAGFRAPGRGSIPDVIVLTGVRGFRLSYFGNPNSAAQRGWRGDWRDSDHLPSLVSFQIEFKDPRRNRPAVLVALRQG